MYLHSLSRSLSAIAKEHAPCLTGEEVWMIESAALMIDEISQLKAKLGEAKKLLRDEIKYRELAKRSPYGLLDASLETDFRIHRSKCNALFQDMAESLKRDDDGS